MGWRGVAWWVAAGRVEVGWDGKGREGNGGVKWPGVGGVGGVGSAVWCGVTWCGVVWGGW